MIRQDIRSTGRMGRLSGELAAFLHDTPLLSAFGITKHEFRWIERVDRPLDYKATAAVPRTRLCFRAYSINDRVDLSSIG